MSGLRFKVGDMAIYVIATNPKGVKKVGSLVSIVEVGLWAHAERIHSTGLRAKKSYDYIARCGDSVGGVFDYQLRKIDPSAEPASLTRECDSEVCA